MPEIRMSAPSTFRSRCSPFVPPASTAKAGANMVGKCLAEDLRNDNIAVGMVHPGYVLTANRFYRVSLVRRNTLGLEISHNCTIAKMLAMDGSGMS